MHGKKRSDYKAKLRDPATADALSHKAHGWHQLCQALAVRRREQQQRQQQQQQQQATLDRSAEEQDGSTAVDSHHKDEPSTTTTTTTPNAATNTTLALLSKALLVNPDPLHLWNHRRECLLELIRRDNHNNNSNVNDNNGWWTQELQLTQAALERNPKAYGPWMHRKWIWGQYQKQQQQHQQQKSSTSSTSTLQQLLEEERTLTTLFLKADERNFHCWNYRRFIVGCLLECAAASTMDDDMGSGSGYGGNWSGEWKGLSSCMGPQLAVAAARPRTTHADDEDGVDVVLDEKDKDDNNNATSTLPPAVPSAAAVAIVQLEFDFTTRKIHDNFSNFSAFFYRSQLLPLLSPTLEQWHDEWRLIENAICTEPDDQTAWWYQALLLRMETFPLKEMKEQGLWHEQHADLLRELLSEDEDYESAAGGGSGSASKWIWMGLHRILHAVGENVDEQRSCLLKLQEIDPDRKQRYQELLDATPHHDDEQ